MIVETKLELNKLPLLCDDLLTYYGSEEKFRAVSYTPFSLIEDQTLKAVGEDVQNWFRKEQNWQAEGLYTTKLNKTGSIEIVLTSDSTQTKIGGWWRFRSLRLDISASLVEPIALELPNISPRQVGPLKKLEDITENYDFSAYINSLTVKTVGLYDKKSNTRKEEDTSRVKVTINLADAPSAVFDLHHRVRDEIEDLYIEEEEILTCARDARDEMEALIADMRSQEEAFFEEAKRVRNKIEALTGRGPQSMTAISDLFKTLEQKPWPFD